MSEANRLLAAAAEIQGFCTSAGWKFCFIGGVAVQHWGEPRLTRDADLTVFTGVGDETRYVDAFEAPWAASRAAASATRILLRIDPPFGFIITA